MIMFFLLLLAILGSVNLENLDGPLIDTPQGVIQGTYKKSYKNKTFSAFEGIPYAKPPVGDLRFEAPQPADPWIDTLIANKDYQCLYLMPFPLLYGPQGSEDCLYIYVYVPREKINSSDLLDVVVHIHGGAFMMGSPKFFAGPEFLMDKDVVLVTFNYRLGILGFLSTEDEVVPGNNGLKDQSLALEWIKQNIKFFGGNPASITITGLSAGGASVHYHYLSPLSKGLFHRGLSQSGTALQCWALVENPLSYAKTVAKNLTCPTSSSSIMIDCLKKLDAAKLIWGVKSVFVYWDAIPFTPFGPVVEKKSQKPFLPDHPYKLITNGNVYDVPWITSNVKDEGVFPVGLFLWMNKLSELDNKWFEIMPYLLDLHNTVDKKVLRKVLSQIREFYFKDEALSKENVNPLVKLMSDRMFLTDVEKAVRLHSEAVKSEIYYYMFSYIPKMGHFPIHTPNGSSHGDDGRLVFKVLLGTPSKLEKSDEKMMESLIEFVASYAKRGVPSLNGVEWLPIKRKSQKLNYLLIENPDQISMKKINNLGSNDFWSSLPIKELANGATGLAKNLSLTSLTVILLTLKYIV